MDIRQTVTEHLKRAVEGLELLVRLADYSGGDPQATHWANLANRAAGLMSDLDPVPVSLEERLRQAIGRTRTVLLVVYRNNGTREDVEYEPYTLEGGVLWCWNVDHRHPEKLAVSRIASFEGEGEWFSYRQEMVK